MKNIVIVLLILFVFKLKAQELDVVGNKVDTVCMQLGSFNAYDESLNPVRFIASVRGGEKPFMYSWKHDLDIQDWITHPSDSILLVNRSFYNGLKNARIVCIVTDAKNNVDSVVWTPTVSNSLADYVFPYKSYFLNVDIRTKRAKLNFEVPSYSITSISGFFNDTIDLVEKGIGSYPYQIGYKKAGCDLAVRGFLTIYSIDSISSSQIQTTEKEVFVYLPEKKRIQLWGMQDSMRFDNYPGELYSGKNMINNCYNYTGFSNCDTATAAYTLEKSNNTRWLILNPQKRGNYKLNFYSIGTDGRIMPFQLKLHVLDTLFEAQGSVRTQEAYLKSGKVQAFRKRNDKSALVQTVDLKSDGTFLFENLAEGNYYFLAIPDDSLLSPTYYVNNEMAQNAYLLDLYGNTESIDILVERKVKLGENSIQQNIAQLIGNENILTAMKPIDDDEYIESYQLVDVSGKVVASGMVLSDFGEYSGQPAGVYVLMLKTNKGMNRKKIVFY